MHNNQFTYCPYYMNRAAHQCLNESLRRAAKKFAAFSGVVTNIDEFSPSQNAETAGCYKLMNIESKDGVLVNFVIAPETYFVDHEVIRVGDKVTGFYDANAPAILIYPPQYPAIVVSKEKNYQSVTVDYFNNQLLSSNGNLLLNIAPDTDMLLTNDQPFNSYPGNRNLIVIYGPTTKSIPAQTTPYKIIVLC